MSQRIPDFLYADTVTVTVGSRHLLEGVSCVVHPGEVLAVLGANGAGKSTLIRVLSGEWTPAAGGVWLGGEPLATLASETVARCRAVLPQSSPLAFPFSVKEVVMMGRAPHVNGLETEQDHAWVRDAMHRADVAHLAERNYLTLSGGEKQRVHWARVMAQLAGVTGERYLLLDEPVSSLDMAHQHACMTLARELAAQGVGVLAVLHDLNLAAMYADRALFLKQGREVGYGRPMELFSTGRIREVFDQEVLVLKHPQRNCPLVVVP